MCMLPIVSIFLMIGKLLRKLDLNCQVPEAKGKLDREKCLLLIKVETLEEPHSSILCVIFFPTSNQVLITSFV